jgi:hypothetical protein
LVTQLASGCASAPSAARASSKYRQAEVALVALGAGGGQLGQRGGRAVEHRLGDPHRGQVGLREVAVVVRLLLGAQRRDRLRPRVEVQRLLDHDAARGQQRLLPGDLGADPLLDEAERVHVLQLGLDPQLRAAGRADRDVRVAAQRALLHVHVADAELAQRRAQQAQELAGLLGRAQVGLGDDLGQRRAAAVEVHDRRRAAVDAPRRARVDELGGVLLEVHAVDAHVAQVPAPAQGLVVLGDLVALGQVGIEVVLAVEDRPRGEVAAERQTDHQAVVDRLGVGDRQRPREAEADRAGARVRRLAEAQRAAAEHLRPGGELDVDLQPDDGLVGRVGGHARTADPSKASAPSSA